jgi:cytoskeletal protein CcmA (bactofilin family)
VVDNRGVLVVGADTVIKGGIRNGRQIEIYGYVEGEIASETVLVHRNGRLFGTIRADRAEVHGEMQGEVFIKHLINIGSSGSVSGKVQYGQLAIEHGGHLSADVRNVPPSLAGDFKLEVGRGQSVAIGAADLSAFDPDNKPEDLTFTISKALRGFIAYASAPGQAVTHFTDADLEAGRMVYTHDGSPGGVGSFDVQVMDKAGANSGPPQIVTVEVRG